MVVAIPVGGISPTTPNTRHGVQRGKLAQAVIRCQAPTAVLALPSAAPPKGIGPAAGPFGGTPERREALGPFETPKRPGDVLAHLQHAQGAFRQIIGEGYGEIVEKSQRGVSITVQAFYQVPRLGLGRPPSGPGGGQFLGILLQSLTNQGVIPFVQGRSEIRSNLRGARGRATWAVSFIS